VEKMNYPTKKVAKNVTKCVALTAKSTMELSINIMKNIKNIILTVIFVNKNLPINISY